LTIKALKKVTNVTLHASVTLFIQRFVYRMNAVEVGKLPSPQPRAHRRCSYWS